MKLSKKISSILVLVLVMAMILPNCAFAAKQASGTLVEGKGKAKLELVYLEADSAASGFKFKEVTTPSFGADDVGKDFYIGVRLTGLANLTDATAGLYSVSHRLVFDENYVTFEPTAQNASGVFQSNRMPNLIKGRLNYTGSLWDAPYDAEFNETANYAKVGEYAYGLGNTSFSRAGLNVEFKWQIPNDDTSSTPIYDGSKEPSFWIAVYQFRVKAIPTGGAKAISFMTEYDTKQNNILLGAHADQTQYDWYGDGVTAETLAANPEALENVMILDASGADVFHVEAPKPTLGGTAAITRSGTAGSNPIVGETLTADTTGITVSDSSTPTYSYQWQRVKNGTATDISNATNATYVLTTADDGYTIRCVITATGCKGSVTAETSAAVIKPPIAGTVTLNNTSPVYNDTVTATANVTTTSPGALTYTWKVGGTTVTNSNTNKATYTVKGTDIGKAITCEVTAANTSGSIASAATNNVGKKTLTLSGISVNTLGEAQKVWADDTGAALTKSNFVFNYKADTTAKATAAGMKLNDTIRFTGVSVTYTDVSVGTKTLTTTTYTMPAGEQNNDYYNVYTGAITVTGEVKASNVKSVTVKTPPTKTSYSVKTGAVDNVLNLAGMEVTLTYDSGKTKDVAFADFAANGITTSPANGDELDGTKTAVTITCNSQTATQALTIAKDATLTKWEVSADNTFKTAYEVGDTINLNGLTVTATWSDSTTTDETANATVKFNGVAVANGDKMTNAMAGAVTVEYNSESKPANKTITVAAKTSEDVVVTNGTATKVYDNNTTVVWAEDAEPTFKLSSDGTTAVELEGVVYTYDNANVGTGKAITADTTNAKIKGTTTKVNITNPEDLKGAITEANPTITLGNLAQYAGSVTEVTAAATPKSDDDVITIEYEVVTTPGVEGVEGVECSKKDDPEHEEHDASCGYVEAVEAVEEVKEWKTWDDAEDILKALPAGSKVSVRAYAAGTKNYAAGDPTNPAAIGELVLSSRPTGGVAPVIPNHEAYIIGDDNGFFRPNDGMTRAEAAVILARASEDFDETAAYSTWLSGVTGHWGANYIGFASSKGYISGYPDASFRPNNGVTRAELAVMVAKFAGIEPVDAYAFADTNGHWAESYIAALKAAGIVIGDGNGFRPDAPISRAEAVTMINRALERTPDAAKIQAAVTASPFYDVKRSDWFFAQVIEAAVAHKPADYHG